MFFIDCYLFLISKSQLNSWFSHCYLVYVDYEIGACTSWLCQNHDQPHDATWDHCTWCFRKSNLDGTHVPYMILLQQSNHQNIHSHEYYFIYSKLWANMLTTLYFAQLHCCYSYNIGYLHSKFLMQLWRVVVPLVSTTCSFFKLNQACKSCCLHILTLFVK